MKIVFHLIQYKLLIYLHISEGKPNFRVIISICIIYEWVKKLDNFLQKIYKKWQNFIFYFY